MKTHCDKPDRDVPKLTCGYPMPCPHHTVMIDGAELLDDEQKGQHTLANLRWLRGRVHINTYFSIEGTVLGAWLRIRTLVTWVKDRGNVSAYDTKEIIADLPLHSPPVDIRNATEEQQIEARAWLEEHRAVPASPVTPEEIEQMRLGIEPNTDYLRDKRHQPLPAAAQDLAVEITRERRGGKKGQRYRNRR